MSAMKGGIEILCEELGEEKWKKDLEKVMLGVASLRT